jgi:hypothetical protein
MRKFTTLVLAATVGLLASAHVAGAETLNSKAQQKMFNPQPDPPGVTAKGNPASQPAKANRRGTKAGKTSIIPIGGGHAKKKMGSPPDDSKSKPGSTAATKMGVSPEPFRPGSKAKAKMGVPPDDSKGAAKSGIGIGSNAAAKGIIVINNKPGGAGAGASAKGLLPAIQAPAGKR